jgi:hypothetical protein
MSVMKIEKVSACCQNSYEPDAQKARKHLKKADNQPCKNIDNIGSQRPTPLGDDILLSGDKSLGFAMSIRFQFLLIFVFRIALAWAVNPVWTGYKARI